MLIIKNTIFLGKNLIVEDEDIAYLCEYIPTHFYKGSDDRSRKFILDFKNGNSKMISLACEQIVNNLGYNFSIAVVPPSKVYKNDSTPCHTLAKMLVSKIGLTNNVKDISKLLARHTDIISLHNGGTRTIDVHLNTIGYRPGISVKGQDILLLDDVFTTGNSIRACISILKSLGARSVSALVIGRTIDKYNLKYGVIFDLDQTLYNTSAIEPYRLNRDWKTAARMAESIKYNPFNGVIELINWIHQQSNIDVCMVTSSPASYARVFANYLKIDKVVAYHDTVNHKPNIEPYCLAKQLMKVYEPFITVVGDQHEDIIPGKILGMKTVLISSLYDGNAEYHFNSFNDFVMKASSIIYRR